MPPNRGFSLVEVLVAMAVLGVAVIGVMSMAGAGRRLGEIAAVRTAQVLAARAVTETDVPADAGGETGIVIIGRRRLAIRVDTIRLHSNLLELTVSVRATGPAGGYQTVLRRGPSGP